LIFKQLEDKDKMKYLEREMKKLESDEIMQKMSDLKNYENMKF